MKSSRKRVDGNQEDANDDENNSEVHIQSSISLPSVTKTRNNINTNGKEKTPPEKETASNSKEKSRSPSPLKTRQNRRKNHPTWNETTNLIAFPPPPMHLPPRPKNVITAHTNAKTNVKPAANKTSQPNNSVENTAHPTPTPTLKKSGHVSNFRRKVQNPRISSQVSYTSKNSTNSTNSHQTTQNPKLKYYQRLVPNSNPSSSKHKNNNHNNTQNLGSSSDNKNRSRHQNRNSTSFKNTKSSKSSNNSQIFQSNRALQNQSSLKNSDTSRKPSRSFSRSPSPSLRSKKPQSSSTSAQQKPHGASALPTKSGNEVSTTVLAATTTNPAPGKQGNVDTKSFETVNQKKKISSKPIISAVSLVFKNQNPRHAGAGAPSIIAYPSKSLTVQNIESKQKVKLNNNNLNNTNNKKSVQSRSLVPQVQLGNARDPKEVEEIRKVEKAIKEGHVFEIRGWNVNSTVRETFLQRGWFEKIRVPKRNQTQAPPTSFQSKKSEDNSDPFKIDGESTQWSVTKRMLNKVPANFIWADWTHKICWPLAFDFQYINRHPQDGFTLKKNLIEPMQKLHWIGTEFGTSVRPFPRCYRLFVDEEKRAFLHDYRLTSCISLLKWFVHSVDQAQEDGAVVKEVKEEGSVVSAISLDLDNETDPMSPFSLLHFIQFAIEQVQNYVRVRRHQDIDEVNEDEGNFDYSTKVNSLFQMQVPKPEEIDVKDKVAEEEEEQQEEFKKKEDEFEKKNSLEKVVDENTEKDVNEISGTVSATTQNPNQNVTKSGTNVIQSVESIKDDSIVVKNNKVSWDTFLNHVYELTHRKAKFEVKVTSKEGAIEEGVKYMEAKRTLEDVKSFWNQYHIDGMRNVWIFKPGDGTQGQDIVVMDKYEDISRLFFNADTSGSLWMAQKYIEKPLTIFKTKFDIRQWFLVSSWNPLIVWMYKKCYLRFSTQLFSLDNLSNSIHLTNKHVQQKYRSHIDPARDHSIPNDNMWHSATFQTYLKTIGKPNIWSKLIYPGMKKAILGILLATRESIVHRPGSFHVHGADFMLSDDFKPWLIEINSNLVYNNSTSITAQLCPQCIRDTLKVILDWRGGANPDVDTGDFELLYRATTKLPSSHDLTTNDLQTSSSKEYLIQGQSLSVSSELPVPESEPDPSPLDKTKDNENIDNYDGQDNEEELDTNG